MRVQTPTHPQTDALQLLPAPSACHPPPFKGAKMRVQAPHTHKPAPSSGAGGAGTQYPGTVRLVIAKCSVDYSGRLNAHLPLATRLIILKADGSVLIHSDSLSYKPLNWMSH